MPNFEVFDAKIASALNRIIHKNPVQKKGQSGGTKSPKEDRFLRGRQIAFLIYEYLRVPGANDSVENYADLYTIALRNDIQECSSRNGTEFYCELRKTHLVISWKDCTN